MQERCGDTGAKGGRELFHTFKINGRHSLTVGNGCSMPYFHVISYLCIKAAWTKAAKFAPMDEIHDSRLCSAMRALMIIKTGVTCNAR